MMGVFVQLNEGSRWAEKYPTGYVIQENGCWQWVGTHAREGYGFWGGQRAHRRMYEAVVGLIPKGLVLDHLCRNPGCVNPAHLEVVTNRENVLRGHGPTARQARQTHCRKGHPLGPWNGRQRECPTCIKARREREKREGVWRDRYQKKREEIRRRAKERYWADPEKFRARARVSKPSFPLPTPTPETGK